MFSFSLELFDGHPILRDGGHVILLDTGSPVTLHTSPELLFCNETVICQSDYMGFSVDGISDLLGTRITTLLGCDVMSRFIVQLDYSQRRVDFSKEEFPGEWQTAEVSSFMGIMVLPLGVEGKKINFFVDTGAKLSYLHQDYCIDKVSIGSKDDFYPGVGSFTTECYNIATSLGAERFNVTYGNLPMLMQMALMMGGVQGIIGYDLFDNFRVCINLAKPSFRYLRSS